ncbi:anti-sigma factor family protein [Micromonospora okii]|uniref:anti-sigma factor family protein n=1 Tax=Micromonospora okii TaxID=1182970 RepID=UPI001E31764B|nr:zf-HC2 domain-containing protein [Micromonospora okii]
MTRCEFAHDDGAYVLGALAPAERAAYERHLAGCACCREAVAEVAALPGLLGRLDPAGLKRLLGPRPAAADRVPVPPAEDRRRRRRERWATRRRYVPAALAAAVVAVLAGLAVPGPRSGGEATPTPTPQPPMVSMRPVAGSAPLRAEVRLAGTAWGTEVTMRCGYDRRGGRREAYTFRLVAHGPDGRTEQVGSWLAAPGDEVRFTGVTRFTGGELVRLELLRADGTPVLAYDAP